MMITTKQDKDNETLCSSSTSLSENIYWEIFIARRISRSIRLSRCDRSKQSLPFSLFSHSFSELTTMYTELEHWHSTMKPPKWLILFHLSYRLFQLFIMNIITELLQQHRSSCHSWSISSCSVCVFFFIIPQLNNKKHYQRTTKWMIKEKQRGNLVLRWW